MLYVSAIICPDLSSSIKAKQGALMIIKATIALLKQRAALLKQTALLKQQALSYPDTAAASAVCIYYVIIGGALRAPLYVHDEIHTAEAAAVSG